MKMTDSKRISLTWVVPVFVALALAAGGRTPAATLRSLIVGFGLYLPFALALAAGLGATGGPGRVTRWLASAPVAALLLLYLRTQTELIHIVSRPLETGAFLLVLWAAAAILPLPTPRSRLRGTAVAGAWAILFLVLLLATDLLGSRFRWHLFAEHRFLGTVSTTLRVRLPDPPPQEVLRRWGLEQRASLPRPATEPTGGNTPGPPIAFILVDTLRADSLAAYGNTENDMPRLDRFARDSHLFLDVLADASWTLPSVASLFTGHLPENLGVLDGQTRLPERATTLAEALRDLEYRTTAFANNLNVSRRSGFDQGFEHFQFVGGRRTYARAETMVNNVSRWLSERPRTHESDFLFVHLMDPHRPYYSGPDNLPHFREFNWAGYRAELHYLDRHLDRLLQLLRREFGPDLVILVISDHGEEIGDHGASGHGHSLYPELTHVPAVLHLAGTSPSEIARPLSARDFFDLLLRIGRGERTTPRAWARSRERQVRYMSSYYTGFPRSVPKLVRLLLPLESTRIRGLQTSDRLSIWNTFGPTWEVYDLSRDPRAHRNLVAYEPANVDLDKLDLKLQEAVGYWSVPEPVRDATDQEQESLEALGYL